MRDVPDGTASNPVLPRLQRGRLFVVIEPTGARFILRWQGCIKQAVRWDPRTVSGGSEWRRERVYPQPWYDGMETGPKWLYAFTREGIKRKLRRWLNAQERERERRAQRVEWAA